MVANAIHSLDCEMQSSVRRYKHTHTHTHVYKLVCTHSDDLVVEKKSVNVKDSQRTLQAELWLGHRSASAEPRAIHLSN